MRSLLVAGLAGLSCLTLAVPSAHAVAIMRPINIPVPQRVVQAGVVFVGKVTGFEEKTVPAKRFPNDKAEYRVATVKVQQGLLGTRGLTHLKVAFLLPQTAPVGPGGGPIRPGGPIRRPFFQPPTLAKDQEALLFLKPHAKESFYVLENTYDVVDKKAPTFAADVAQARKSVKLIADPMAGLKSKAAADRFDTAAMLISRYRTPQGGMKTEMVSAEESKLILLALAGADWTQMPRPGLGFNPLNPQNLFGMLQLQPADGWTQPMDFRQFPDAAKAWLKANAGKYRIKRFVAEKAEK